MLYSYNLPSNETEVQTATILWKPLVWSSKQTDSNGKKDTDVLINPVDDIPDFL